MVKRVCLLQARHDFAQVLAENIESQYPEYDVDTLVHPMSRKTRISRALEGEYDLIQVDETLRNGLLGSLRSRLKRTPLALYFRGWADYTNAHGEHGWLKQRTVRRRTVSVTGSADRIMYISNACRERLRNEYELPEGCIVRRPFDVAEYSRPKDEDTETEPEVLTLTTVTNLRYPGKYQGVRTTLEGLAPLFSEYDIQYKIAGDGRFLDKLHQYLDGYEHQDKVELLGYVSDVPELLWSSDVFVYLSFCDAYPTVILEAQASGLPVVGGDAGGVPETVADAGIVCPSDSEGVGAAVEKIITEPGTRKELSEKSRRRMETYNQMIAEQFVKEWTKIIAK